jgi:hypothetical protein
MDIADIKERKRNEKCPLAGSPGYYDIFNTGNFFGKETDDISEYLRERKV